MEFIYFDPDNRKEPKAESFCVRCKKEVDPSKALRVTVHPEMSMLCALDEQGTDLLGKDCFKKITKERQ